jgi:hypothetical protein
MTGSSSRPCSAGAGGDPASVRRIIFAPISTKQERGLQATTLLPIVVLRLLGVEQME